MPADKKISENPVYTPPIDADVIPIVDNTTSVTKKITWANIKAALKTYFDSLTTTLTNKTLTSPVINTPTGDVVTKTGAQTLTNKRNTKRAYSTTSLSTLTPEIDTYDMFSLTALAHALDIANHSTSTPTAGDCILVNITPDATPRALTYGTNYVAYSGVALPTTTVASKKMQMLFIWLPVGKYSISWVGNEA